VPHRGHLADDDYNVAGDTVLCAATRGGGSTCGVVDAMDPDVPVALCVAHNTGTNDTAVWLNGNCEGDPYVTELASAPGVEIGGLRVLSPNTANDFITVDNAKCQLNPPGATDWRDDL
jgi:hypothetical protein